MAERLIDKNLADQYKVQLCKTEADHYHTPRLDESTRAMLTIDGPHHEIHDCCSFTAYYTITTAATDAHRSGLYLKTGPLIEIHAVISFSASTAGAYSLCEAPTIASNIGTHAVAIYNRDRNSASASTCFDNAATPAVNKYTTLTEAEIAGDVTWATGTIIRTEPLEVGAGPKPAGGAGRDSQEYILKKDTAYVFLITNTVALANTHHILVDWYEHESHRD